MKKLLAVKGLKNVALTLPWCCSMMYWGDEGVPGIEPKVFAVNMDGTNAHPLMMTGINLRQPSHLALDYGSQVLYISDTYYYKVDMHGFILL
jgi:hypothetical protein